MLDLGHWYPVKDADPRAAAILSRHYSKRGRRTENYTRTGFSGVGERMVLLTLRHDAVWIWRRRLQPQKSSYWDGQNGVMCAAFHNESDIPSSELVREATELALTRWAEERLFTYVDPKAIRSTNPGYCYKLAGWKKCGVSKGGLVILEYLPPQSQTRGRC